MIICSMQGVLLPKQTYEHPFGDNCYPEGAKVSPVKDYL